MQYVLSAYANAKVLTGSGIGLAVTKYLHEKGWRLSLVDLSEERGQIAAKEVNGIFIKADVTRYDDQAIAFQKTWETYGQLDFGKKTV